MLFFRERSGWQRVVVLAAPLLVIGALVWQRQTMIASPGRALVELTSGDHESLPVEISPEEWQAASAEFAGVADSTFQCGAEEMPAYWRLLKWSVWQSADAGGENRFGRVSFNELVNRPNAWRGRAVQVDLHVCRIVECAAPVNRLNIERLYEVWGWSDDSRGALYVAITPELPAGMSVGESVCERASIFGYFYKIQGYLAAGSAAQTLPAAAPLVIGRMSRWDMPVPALACWNELWFGGAGLLLAGSFLLLLSQRSLFRRRRREQVRPLAAAKLESWVDSFGTEAGSEKVISAAMVSSS